MPAKNEGNKIIGLRSYSRPPGGAGVPFPSSIWTAASHHSSLHHLLHDTAGVVVEGRTRVFGGLPSSSRVRHHPPQGTAPSNLIPPTPLLDFFFLFLRAAPTYSRQSLSSFGHVNTRAHLSGVASWFGVIFAPRWFARVRELPVPACCWCAVRVFRGEGFSPWKTVVLFAFDCFVCFWFSILSLLFDFPFWVLFVQTFKSHRGTTRHIRWPIQTFRRDCLARLAGSTLSVSLDNSQVRKGKKWN